MQRCSVEYLSSPKVVFTFFCIDLPYNVSWDVVGMVLHMEEEHLLVLQFFGRILNAGWWFINLMNSADEHLAE